MRPRRRQAFTLMEMILVLAIIVILGALSFPALESFYSGVQVDAGADGVRAAWAEAQAHAVNEGRAYRFAILSGQGNYRVAPDGADFWEGNGAGATDTDSGDPPYVLDSAMPKGVAFTEAGADAAVPSGETSTAKGSVDPSQWETVAVFLPDGTARDNAEVTIRAAGARAVTLRLRGLTGVVTVQR